MTTFLFVIAGLVVLFVGYFFVLGFLSKSGSPPGLVGDQLAKCPNKPNCVCSEYSDDQAHSIASIDIAGMDVDVANNKIKLAIQTVGGTLIQEDKHYMAFTFTSSVFRFVDDVEVRLDLDNNALHLRSASRVGHSDLGANKKRVEAIRAAFKP